MKKLRILLANNTLSFLGGSETWTYTMALELKRLGHTVNCFSGNLGLISDQLKKEGVPCLNVVSNNGVKPFSFVLEEDIGSNYDIIISAHFNTVDYLREQFPNTPIISVIHGIIHYMDEDEKVWAPEHPATNAKVNKFIAVSEEVSQLVKNNYGIEATVIRNFINTDLYKTRKKINKTPKRFFLNTNYYNPKDEKVLILKEVAKHYGAKLGAVGINFSQSFDLKPMIESADIVFGLGRSVLEGMAMGRVGFVWGRWGDSGIVREGNYESIRLQNFSGRNSVDKHMTAEEIIKEIDENYNQEAGNWSRDYILKNHNVKLTAELMINISRDLLEPDTIQSTQPELRPYRLEK